MSNDSPPDRSLLTRSPVGSHHLAAAALAVLLVAAAGPVVADGADPAFEENVIKSGEDGVATMNVTLGNGSTTGFWIDSDRRTRISAELVDADSDGQIALRIDVGDASPDGTPLEAAGADRVQDVTVRNATASGQFYQGSYDLIVGPGKDSSSSDFGALAVLTGATPDPTPTPNPTPTADPTTTSTPKHLNGTVVVHDGEYVSVPNETDVRIHGETHLPAGTELSVTIQSTADTMPGFYDNLGATVAADGTFSVTVDVSENHPGDRFDITVERDGTTLTSAQGRIAACRDCETPTPTVTASDSPGFVNDTVHVVQSRTAEIPVRTDISNATLVIGHEPSTGYEQRVRIDDTDGNGIVVVGFSTWVAGTNGTTVDDVTGNDRVVDQYETGLESPLAAGGYDLVLYRGNGTNGEPVDSASLVVHKAPSWSELKQAEESTPRPATASSATATDPPTGDRTIYGVGGLAVGGSLGIGGVLLLLRRGRF